MMKFEIQPYIGALPLKFGMLEKDIVELLGSQTLPPNSSKDFTTLNYDTFSLGLRNSDGTLVHIGFLPGSSVVMDGCDPFSAGAFELFLKKDGDPREFMGLIFLMNLGIYFSGVHDHDDSQKAFCMFAKGTHDSRIPKMKPFVFQPPV